MHLGHGFILNANDVVKETKQKLLSGLYGEGGGYNTPNYTRQYAQHRGNMPLCGSYYPNPCWVNMPRVVNMAIVGAYYPV